MISISKENFSEEVLKSSKPVMVDFFAPWCGPCKQLEPILNELENEYRDKIKIVKLNVNEEMGLAQKYEVMNVPTVLFFKDGNIVDNVIGLLPKNKIAGKINNL